MTDTIYKKLAKTQDELGVLEKDKANPYFKSKYLSLDKITNRVMPIAHANGLLIVQLVDGDQLVTQVIDIDSGDKIESKCNICSAPGDPQKQGSAITYARRYSLGAIFQICTEDDDDANSASGRGQAPQKKVRQKAPLNPESPRWAGAIQALKDGKTTTKIILQNFDVPKEFVEDLKKAEVL